MPIYVPVRRLAAFSLLITSGACASLRYQAFAPPEVVVNDVRLAGLGVQGGRVDVFLTLFNHNNYRVDATDVEYHVTVDTLEIGSGTITDRISLSRKDSTQIRIPVNFGFREVAAASTQLSQRGTLPFQVAGSIRVLTPLGSVTREFRQRGTYDGLNISLMRGR